MTKEIRVPALGESVTEATVAQWFKQPGDAVTADEPLVELETDKVTVEVPAPASGVLSAIDVADGETVEVGTLLGSLTEGEVPEAAPPASLTPAPEAPSSSPATPSAPPSGSSEVPLPPSARRLVEENNVDAAAIQGTGKGGRVVKQDVMDAIAAGVRAESAARGGGVSIPSVPVDESALEERVPMSRLRQTIASRLKAAQETAAILTTFNEVDMSALQAIRSEYRDLFEKKHGVRLGYMSFFVRACVAALEEVPSVNASIDNNEIIYRRYCHIGIAVATDKGLVVPVLRNAQSMGLADIEKSIGDFGHRAREGSLSMDDLQGGTFSISNGGVFGSLMSTPILNTPQSGILGMHRVQDRPVVVDGNIVVRPMMYLALSYDHRLVDGREAVTFLVRIKENLEDPHRLLLSL
ncbi:MAG: 2-oxoglutarate dehydrogenase complex dihydrolipoyllysine-residue succinyltransferase [Parvularculales bacterium]